MKQLHAPRYIVSDHLNGYARSKSSPLPCGLPLVVLNSHMQCNLWSIDDFLKNFTQRWLWPPFLIRYAIYTTAICNYRLDKLDAAVSTT